MTKTMRAARMHAVAEPMRLETVPVPATGRPRETENTSTPFEPGRCRHASTARSTSGSRQKPTARASTSTSTHRPRASTERSSKACARWPEVAPPSTSAPATAD